MANILIIDDDKMICDMLSRKIGGMGHNVTCSLTLEEGEKAAFAGAFDVVFLDVRMPDGNGLEVLPVIRGAPSAPEVIIMTGMGDPSGAELAVKCGAWDYLEKGSSTKEIILPLVRALQYREEKLARKPPLVLNREGIVGDSPQMRACLELLAQAASSSANILISGETGTGKELFARAIHDNSPRRNKNFVVVDCAALPENLVESTLFGHLKGSFTGAHSDRVGLIEQADGGVLFLDEVGELPLSLQKSFLRFLQERSFRPVGSNKEVTSNFRLIAATNRDIDQKVEEGLFRKDLLFRLRSLNIELPPLRERPRDIREIAMFYVTRLCEKERIGIKGFSPEFIEALVIYDWPGNVRELVSTLERVIATAGNDPTFFPYHLPTHIRVQVARASVSGNSSGSPDGIDFDKELPRLHEARESAIAEIERKYLEKLLSSTGSDIKEACSVSGLSRSRLYALLKKHKLSKRGLADEQSDT